MNATDKISKFFTYAEATRINKRFYGNIDNTPTQEHLDNLIALATNISDPCREFIGAPLDGLFYRSTAMNALTPGADPNSQHCLGQAVDLDCDTYGYGTNKELFDFIRAKLPFDIITWEFGTNDHPDWVHVSYRLPKYGANRRFAKRAYKDDKGVTHYVPFDLY